MQSGQLARISPDFDFARLAPGAGTRRLVVGGWAASDGRWSPPVWRGISKSPSLRFPGRWKRIRHREKRNLSRSIPPPRVWANLSLYQPLHPILRALLEPSAQSDLLLWSSGREFLVFWNEGGENLESGAAGKP